MDFSCASLVERSRAWRLQLGVAMLLGCAQLSPVLASQPAEQVVCTQAPRHTWMSEAQARERFKADQYLLAQFKVSRGRCHEFYAVAHDGSVVEAYLHPVTGEAVRFTRLPAPAAPSFQP